MRLLRQTSALLLEMPVRILHLPELHGEKLLGDVLQRHYLAVSGLRRTKRLWKPIAENIGILSRLAADTTPAIRADGADAAFIAAELSIFPGCILGISGNLWLRRLLFCERLLLGFFLNGAAAVAGSIWIRGGCCIQKPANPASIIRSNDPDATVITAKPAVFPLRVCFERVSLHVEALLSGCCLLNLLRFRQW